MIPRSWNETTSKQSRVLIYVTDEGSKTCRNLSEPIHTDALPQQEPHKGSTYQQTIVRQRYFARVFLVGPLVKYAGAVPGLDDLLHNGFGELGMSLHGDNVAWRVHSLHLTSWRRPERLDPLRIREGDIPVHLMYVLRSCQYTGGRPSRSRTRTSVPNTSRPLGVS